MNLVYYELELRCCRDEDEKRDLNYYNYTRRRRRRLQPREDTNQVSRKPSFSREHTALLRTDEYMSMRKSATTTTSPVKAVTYNSAGVKNCRKEFDKEERKCQYL